MEERKRREEEAFLSLQNLVKVYPNGEKAVHGFDLDIHKNEFLVIVGPSGCGKSTTLRMIAGLEDISSGDIFLEGELLNYKPCKDRRMAIVFQSYALYPQMNVFGNIAFPLTINKYEMPAVNETLRACAELKELFSSVRAEEVAEVAGGRGKEGKREENAAEIFGISLHAAKMLCRLCASSRGVREGIPDEWKAAVEEAEAKERALLSAKNIRVGENFCELDADGKERRVLRRLTPYEIKVKVYETAEKLDLTPYLDKLPKELSGGQMQRVALGRAIVKDVPVFLMDEPLSNLDAKLRLTMRSEIVKLHNRIGATTVYVTHDQTEAMTMATRIAVMSKGFIQQIGTPEEIYNGPCNIFVARFIGSPAMNVFGMQADRDGRLSCGELEIGPDASFLAAHDAFYREQVGRFGAMAASFDEDAREEILKTLSVTGEYSDTKNYKKGRESLWASVKRKLKKLPEPEKGSFEKGVCEQKLGQLRECTESGHTVLAGIRPERLKIEKYREGTSYENAIVVLPTVCELLGGEYNVHFDFCGQDMVGRVDAKDKIENGESIVVRFPPEDLYIFDPITGGRIR